MNKTRILTLLGLLLITSSSNAFAAKTNDFAQKPSQSPLFSQKFALNFNGTYEVPLDLDMKMGAEKFSKTGVVEKTATDCYFTFTVVDPSNLSEIKLMSEGRVGEMRRTVGNAISYTYTVSESDLSKPFNFKTKVVSMDKVVDFTVKLHLNDATFKSDSIEDRGERPARFIPVIETNATDLEIEKGSLYFLPEAKGTLNTKDIDVTSKVYYLNGNTREEIDTTDNKFKADKLGKYELVYTAESDLYKTSLGNNTKEELKYTITSKVGATSIGKLEDTNNVLPKGAQLQVNIVKTGDAFDKCKSKMKDIADNFQVFEIHIYDENGNELETKEKVSIYLRVDDFFDRHELKLASFNNKFKNYNVENYGRYIKFNTNETGIYVAYVEGVEFNMPIWGWALIGVSCFAVVASGVITLIVIKVKQKKKFLKELENI